MSIVDQEQELLKTINNKLDQRVVEIDDSTKEALRNIRKTAISHASAKPTNNWQWLQPAPIMAVASIVLIVSISLRMTINTDIQPSPALEDIPLLTASDDIDFYNDLEFYQWLEAEKLNG